MPLLSIVFRLLNGNSRVINYLTLNRYKANDSFDFQEKIDKIISNKKMIALDVGSQGGFNSDVFFSKKYEKYFKSILVDPLKDSSIKEGFHYINKGFWSSKEKKKIYILGKRPGSSSMYEPD